MPRITGVTDGVYATRSTKSCMARSKAMCTILLDFNTGLPIDFRVLSNYCALCIIYKKKYPNDSNGKHEGYCNKTFDGNVMAMEGEANKQISKDIVDGLQLLVDQLISDGDCNNNKSWNLHTHGGVNG